MFDLYKIDAEGVHFPRIEAIQERLARDIAADCDGKIRSSLIKMGWTPPPAPHPESAVGNEREKQISADDEWLMSHVDLTREEARITPCMMRAGVAALANWNYDDEEPEAAIAAIWYAMQRARKHPIRA